LKSLKKVVNYLKGREKGEINIAGLMMMGIAMIFVAVGFIIYPVITDATDTILAYVYSANNTITDASFTGLTSVTGIVPLIVLIGFLTAGVISGFMGYKMVKGGNGGGGINLGSLLMLGIGMIFIAVGLIIFPVIMDGVASVLHGGGHGISTTYTGLSSVLLVTPLIVLTAFIAGGVVSSFFGIKGMSSAR
jgi:hypothetical protein